MRWIFFALVASNVLYFAWQVNDGSVSDHRAEKGDVAYVEPSIPMQSELPSGSATDFDSSTRDESALAAANVPAGGELCWMIGPFPEVITAKQVGLRLEGEGVGGEIKSVELSAVDEYWLYLGPYASRALAVNSLMAIQKMGIEAFLISEGKLSNAVSLGIYAERSDAESALTQFADKGLVVKLAQTPGVVTQLWFVARSGQTIQDDMDAFWRDLEVDFPGVGRRQSWCRGVAKYASVE